MRKKRLCSVFALLALTVGLSFTMTSCGDDDKEINPVPVPVITADTNVRYLITDDVSDFEAVEFTDKGTFIITMYCDGSSKNAQMSKKRMAQQDEDAHSAGILAFTGKYVRQDNVYTLQDYGTITVVFDANGTAEKLVIKETASGTSFTLGVKAQTASAMSSATEKICKEWVLDSLEYTYTDKSTNETLSGRGTIAQLKELFPEDFSEYNPVSITATANGTYLVEYVEEGFAIAKWRWTDDSQNVFQYCWEYDGDETFWDNEDGTGVVTVSYQNDQLVLFEAWEGEDSKDTTKYWLSEKK